MTLSFNDLLRLAEIEPAAVNVMLHSPNEGNLGELLPSLARTRRVAVEAYNAMHSSLPAERALMKGRPLVAVFGKASRERDGSRSLMLFIGMYRNGGSRLRSHAELMREPEVCWLHEQFGYAESLAGRRDDLFERWFDLTQTDDLLDLQGRLVILARLTPSYVRRAERLEAQVAAIYETGVFDSPPPPWREMVVDAATVQEMPPGWAARLREWRGIYLIVDHRDGARYVGAAYGEENLLGRWRSHVAGAFGTTAGLADRSPATFRFSILERVSPDMPIEEVTALEQTWMARLGTKAHGLNR